MYIYIHGWCSCLLTSLDISSFGTWLWTKTSKHWESTNEEWIYVCPKMRETPKLREAINPMELGCRFRQTHLKEFMCVLSLDGFFCSWFICRGKPGNLSDFFKRKTKDRKQSIIAILAGEPLHRRWFHWNYWNRIWCHEIGPNLAFLQFDMGNVLKFAMIDENMQKPAKIHHETPILLGEFQLNIPFRTRCFSQVPFKWP